MDERHKLIDINLRSMEFMNYQYFKKREMIYMILMFKTYFIKKKNLKIVENHIVIQELFDILILLAEKLFWN